MQVGRRAFTGGGFVNHVLFWNCMAKNGTEIDPKGALIKAIDKSMTCPKPLTLTKPRTLNTNP